MSSVKKWKPRRKMLKKAVIRTSFFALGRAFEAAAYLDADVKDEIRDWKEPTTILFQVLPHGPSMVLEKVGGRVRYGGQEPVPADLTIFFKNVESAFLVMSGQMGTPQGYAEHRMALKGDTSQAMPLIRCLNQVQAYLFPRVMAKRVMKRVPRMNIRKTAIRVVVLAVGVPVGLSNVAS
ncbi:MAG: hypothetical protein ACLFOY_02560 [Desulfatibacillaceae bacterium]